MSGANETTVAAAAPEAAVETTATAAATAPETAPETAASPAGEETTTAETAAASASTPAPAAETTTTTTDTTPRERTDSLSIQPHQDTIGTGAASAPSADGSPVCNITLLLPTGARHPFRIDDRYLTKRSVEVPGTTADGKKDPFSISIYKLKELILREWREEWDGKPASPSSIRLIHFGKLLDDKEVLSKYQFSAEAPNVVHMTVKPPDMVEEDEAAKSKTGARGDARSGEHGSSSACCVIL